MAGISKPRIDLSNQTFHYLKVIKWERLDIKSDNPKASKGYWLCQCKCGNTIYVRTNALTNNRVKSCGCYAVEKKNQRKKYNEYDLSKEYGIGYATNNNTEFYFDLEDYEKIKKYTWAEKNNYIKTVISGKDVLLHRFVLNLTPKDKVVVDHIGHNTCDNRKSKLRITNDFGNHRNKSLSKNNTSGVTGVSYEKNSKKWHSYIWYDNKCLHIGRFDNFEDAVKARKDKENELYGDFSYDNSIKIYKEE